ncbi:putative membrane protein [Pseudomonas phage vB_PaeM_USP_18]|nr:putative membrane protein [Pseudomonas phage vB_PaeM_USP_18]
MHGRTGERMKVLNIELKVPVWLMAIVAVLVIAMGLGTHHYRAIYLATDKALIALEDSVKQANQEAADKLARLTAERDERQARLDKQKKDQEKQDADAKAEIERLAGELRDRPVRVRYVTAASGQGSGGAASHPTGDPGASAGNATAASGVLPPENSRRLGIALKEVETLSAAYNSCRSFLVANTD